MAKALIEPKASVAEYIEGELRSEVRHEYLAGETYAMVGASDAHNIVCLNLATVLHTHLRGGPCRVFMADMKLRVRAGQDEYFYYPDLMVACRPEDDARYYREQPILIVEVMSESTERIDRREKLLVYRDIPVLEEYLLLAQDRAEATLYRRADGWGSRRLAAGDELQLSSVDFSVPLRVLYEGVPGIGPEAARGR
jgi:Uma2 family endonuclease